MAYDHIEYRDALSKALSYLLQPDEGLIETYSRIVYSFLADGLVLLIGFSLRKKHTAIYRIRNRRDLTNEEPRLISEAFYNLAAHSIDGTDNSSFQVSTLLQHLEKFISYFEPTPFMRDINLNTSYSLICRGQEKINKINTEFKELICLLCSLKYIKPLSEKQYEFFTQYKLNKASIESKDSDSIIASLPDLNGQDTEYCYLMTEGFALYFSEKTNDLYQHIETDGYKKEITDELIKSKKEGK